VSDLIIESKKKDGGHAIKVMGSLNGSGAHELVKIIENDIDGSTEFLLDFKDVKHINQFALHILADALKSPLYKGHEIQFSGLTAQEATILRSQGIKISIGKNCLHILKKGFHPRTKVEIIDQ
jgi:anti-anti-sigma regulatory factor